MLGQTWNLFKSNNFYSDISLFRMSTNGSSSGKLYPAAAGDDGDENEHDESSVVASPAVSSRQ